MELSISNLHVTEKTMKTDETRERRAQKDRHTLPKLTRIRLTERTILVIPFTFFKLNFFYLLNYCLFLCFIPFLLHEWKHWSERKWAGAGDRGRTPERVTGLEIYCSFDVRAVFLSDSNCKMRQKKRLRTFGASVFVTDSALAYSSFFFSSSMSSNKAKRFDK